MTASSEASDNHPHVDELFAEYLLQVDRGESIDCANFLQQHSEHVEELRELMALDDVLRCMRLES